MRRSCVTTILPGSVVAALFAAVLSLSPEWEVSAGERQPAPAENLPADLALVPADAAGFLHLRGAELWQSEMFAQLRAIYEKAGPKALALLDQQFVPKPTTFDRATGFVLMRSDKDRQPEPLPFGILRFSAPFDSAEVVTAYLPRATAEKINGKTIYRSEEVPFELYFPDRQHILIGRTGTIATYLSHKSPATGPLSAGLKLAAAGKPVVLAVNVSALPVPVAALEAFAPGAEALLKAEHITATVDLKDPARIEVVAGYKTAGEAEAAEKAVKTLAEVGRKELARVKEELEKKLFDPKVKSPRPLEDLPETALMIFGLGSINSADELLANPGAIIKRKGTELTAGFPIPKEIFAGSAGLAAMGIGLLLPAVQKVREAAARASTQNNMKQIALAIHNYSDAYGHLPNNITDKDGKPLLSWRVAILPFIEQQALYNRFKLDEPWDSTHNKPLSAMVIKTYTSPNANPPTAAGMTFYKGFAGPGTVFEPGKKIRLITDIPDGTTNTILIVEAGPAVPWAKPEDFSYDPKKPLPKLELPGVPNIVNVGMCDGSVRVIQPKNISEKTLRNAITRDDGNPLGADW